MASNPMQRKVRNSFLLGILVATIILGCIIGILIYQIQQQKKEKEKAEIAKKTVYVLTKDVSAGGEVLPKDKEGKTAEDLLKMVEVDAQVVPATAITNLNRSSAITENTLFKIELKAGTILTENMLVNKEDVAKDEIREQELNMIVLPTYLKKDDYIDIRLRLPSGEDYIVVSKKRAIDTDDTTIWMHLSEQEILALSNAIVEAYQIIGAELYATTYVEPGIQNPATPTYVPSVSVIKLINSDPNIVDTAKKELADRYNKLMSGRIEIIDTAINAGAEDAQQNVSTGVSTSIEKQKQSRTEYLQELEASATQVPVQ